MNRNNSGGGSAGALLVAETGNDYDLEWEESLRNAPPVKSYQTRLLDMLVGWLNYVAKDEFPDNPKVGEEIASLYQMAGQIPFDQMTSHEAEGAIRDFLTERVLKVITL